MTTSTTTAQSPTVSPELAQIEQPFVGRWNQLISTTNWEKGRIIHDWREAIIVAGAPAADYTDEAWSQRVGGVSSQHVGRLRRVFQRFGSSYERYPGLYWSHFQAAIEWDDAEMWLEGAVQNCWSVSAMRHMRWETLGQNPGDRPSDEDLIRVEVDEDYDASLDDAQSTDDRRAHFDDGPPIPEGPDFGDADEVADGSRGHDATSESDKDRASVPPVRPFENLRELPPDLADAFDAFKLAILRHKAEGWQQISRNDVLGSLDALKELAKESRV